MIALPTFGAEANTGPSAVSSKYYPVSENYFKEKHLRDEAIKDLDISLIGDWSNMDVVRLTYILKEVDKLRPTREASISEFSDIKILTFAKGEAPNFHANFENYMNPAAIYGSGISSITKFEFTLSMTATDDELIAFIAEEMPERLIKDQTRLEKWRNMVAKTRVGHWCESLLESFGLK